MATDIAFAVGVLALLGARGTGGVPSTTAAGAARERIPRGLKVYVLTLAIADDIGAIVVIAVFYTAGFDAGWLLGAVAGLGLIAVLRRVGVARPVAYAPLALAVWYCTYRSGIHPTIAGVMLGLFTPAGLVGGRPVLENLEARLHPWSSYLVIPVFALANAGVALDREAIADAAGSRLTWAVVVGLVVGKLAGVAGTTLAAVRRRHLRLPDGVGTRHVLGAGAVSGIGFTVSLFITDLALESEALQAQAKVGILAGSLVAALLGSAILRRAGPAS